MRILLDPNEGGESSSASFNDTGSTAVMDTPAALNGWGDPIKPGAIDDAPDTAETNLDDKGTRSTENEPVTQEGEKKVETKKPSAPVVEEEMIPLPDELKDLVNEPDKKVKPEDEFEKMVNPDGKATKVEQRYENLRKVFDKQANELGELRKKAQLSEQASALFQNDDKGQPQALNFDKIIEIAGGIDNFSSFLRDNYPSVVGNYGVDPEIAELAKYETTTDYLNNLENSNPELYDSIVTDPKQLSKLSDNFAKAKIETSKQALAKEKLGTRIKSVIQDAPSKYKDWDTIKDTVRAETQNLAPLLSQTVDPAAAMELAVRLAREKDSGNRGVKLYNEGYKKGREAALKASGASGKVSGQNASPKTDDDTPAQSETLAKARREWGL